MLARRSPETVEALETLQQHERAGAGGRWWGRSPPVSERFDAAGSERRDARPDRQWLFKFANALAHLAAFAMHDARDRGHFSAATVRLLSNLAATHAVMHTSLYLYPVKTHPASADFVGEPAPPETDPVYPTPLERSESLLRQVEAGQLRSSVLRSARPHAVTN